MAEDIDITYVKTAVVSPDDTYYIDAANAGAQVQAATSGFIFSGPHFIEEQQLDIDYFRVPFGTQGSTINISLSGVTADAMVAGSFLACRIEARYRTRKVFANYSTSTYIAPQKFSLYAVSSDPWGRTYGSAVDFTASCLGPMGTIKTTQAYQNRRPWRHGDLCSSALSATMGCTNGVSSFDIEVNKYISNCFNVACGNTNTVYSAWNSSWPHLTEYRRYLVPPGQVMALINEYDPFFYYSERVGIIPGGYSYKKDGSQNMIIPLIERISDMVTNSQLVVEYPGSGGPPNAPLAVDRAGIPEYSSLKHSYVS